MFEGQTGVAESTSGLLEEGLLALMRYQRTCKIRPIHSGLRQKGLEC